jgi:hypothetical protein
MDWEGATCLEYASHYGQRMFLESWHTMFAAKSTDKMNKRSSLRKWFSYSKPKRQTIAAQKCVLKFLPSRVALGHASSLLSLFMPERHARG